MTSREKWMSIAWAAWVCLVLAFTFQPFLQNLRIFRQVDPALYGLILAALGAAIVAALAYHFVRRLGFWRWEPVVIPIALILLCGFYAPAGAAVALWILAAAFATGRFATGKFGIPADLALSTLSGLGIFSFLLFGLGVTHAFYTWVFALLFTLPLLLFWKSFRDLGPELRAMHSGWLRAPEMTAPHVSIAMFAAIVLGIITAATVVTPAWNGDTIQFHLPLVRVFFSTHALTVPKPIPYGYFPQGFEVLATAAFGLAGQTAAQFINPIFFGCTILVLYRISRACGVSPSWAVAGVIVAISIPFIHWSGSVTKNDLALTAYQLAAFLCLFHWRNTRLFRWILLSGFFIALSFGIKHVAIFGAVPWAIACAVALWRQQMWFLRAAALAAIILVFGCLWPARAYLATGNPLAPANTTSTLRGRGDRLTHNRLRRLVITPYSLHFRGRGFQSPTKNPLGIVLLLFAPVWFIRRASGTNWGTERLLWLVVILYYPFWALEAGILRYSITPVLLLAILGAARLALFPRPLAIAAMGAALLFSFPIIILIEMAPDQIPFFLKQIDAATFLRRTLAPYGAVEFLSQHATASDSIASLGNWASAYSPNPAKFHLAYLNERQYPVSLVLKLVQPGDRYLILPRHGNLAELESAVRQDHTLTRVYQDHEFVVDSLQPTAPLLSQPRLPEPRP
jgi:hypothetical protein